MKLIVYTDGGSRGNPGPSGLGVAIYNSHHTLQEKRYKFLGVMTNNQAEYWGALYGLRRAIEMGATHIELRMDSLLVVSQLSGKWKIKDPDLRLLFQDVRKLLEEHTHVHMTYTAIPREKNTVADALSNKAMDEWKQ